MAPCGSRFLVYIVALALFSTSLAKEFWSLHWSNEDCSGQVVTAYKYLTCYQGQHNYCEGNTPTTTTYSSNVCGRQPSNTNQTAPDNCDKGIQVVCSDQAPDTLMLYYTDANDENCTTLAREVWQTKLDTCIASNREDSLYLIVRCNSTGYPWMTSCRDFTCEMDCTSPRPFQVITVAPGTCAGGILLNRPNICQPSSDEIQPTAADAPTQPESGNTSGTVSVLFAPDTWLQGIIVMVLQYLS